MEELQTLLPRPKRTDSLPGQCLVGENSQLQVRATDPRLAREALRWMEALPTLDHPAPIRIVVDAHAISRPSEYRIDATQDHVHVLGGSAEACFHGLQTLRQLTSKNGAIVCCRIVDWPDLSVRGLLHDVTRGKVPTVDTVRCLIDRLSLLKINQLQLYIEHAFAFSFDPDICPPDKGLTPDEIRELDAYARERFIDLVPSVATFGHMGRVLSLPKYRHLAEIPSTADWSDMPWPQRMRGFTLDCLNPESHQLVERIWTDIFAAFSSPIVNICGDEPWDLGEGRNKGKLSGARKGMAYLDHIERTHRFCEKHGRRTQFWSDVVTHYPDLFDRVPRESTALHWGYDDRSDYEGTKRFVDAGLTTVVCPGVSGWKRVVNGMNLAERNIATFAAAAKKHGAAGLLNTDWGDHGHFNLLACSWHGIALGAAAAWDGDHPTGDDFDKQFMRIFHHMDDERGIALLRGASKLGDRCESWRLLWQPCQQVASESTIPSRDELASIHDASKRAREWWMSAGQAASASTENATGALAQDRRELAIACEINGLVAEKLAGLQGEPTDSKDWSSRLRSAMEEYAPRWLARNKHCGLSDILSALLTAMEDYTSFHQADELVVDFEARRHRGT